MKLNVGAGPHYAEGWFNTDLVETDDIRPDLVVTGADPFPFEDGTIERVYCGHVFEHVPWHEVPAWLGMLEGTLAAGAEVMFVGPDTVRVLNRWKNGEDDWHRVAAIIEGTGAYLEHCGQYQPIRWSADRHHWNCHEARVVEALQLEGWETEAYGILDDGRLDQDRILGEGWPLVDGSPRQFAVKAWRP